MPYRHTKNIEQARKTRETAEDEFREAQEKEEKGRNEVAKLENERRTKSDERAQRLADYSRLKAQLEVLEQAEQSLAGYAEGARYLLDAARQMRLTGARGALSTSLDVPAELEVAVAAALGETLDAILLDTSEIEDALQLLEENETGRAALLPLNDHQRQPLAQPSDENFLGVASELVNAPEELRAAVELMLGQTLIVRDRATARRLIKDLPASRACGHPARGSLSRRWIDHRRKIRIFFGFESSAPKTGVDRIPGCIEYEY